MPVRALGNRASMNAAMRDAVHIISDVTGLRIAPANHLEKPFLSGQPRLGPLAVLDVGTRSITDLGILSMGPLGILRMAVPHAVSDR